MRRLLDLLSLHARELLAMGVCLGLLVWMLGGGR